MRRLLSIGVLAALVGLAIAGALAASSEKPGATLLGLDYGERSRLVRVDPETLRVAAIDS